MKDFPSFLYFPSFMSKHSQTFLKHASPLTCETCIMGAVRLYNTNIIVGPDTLKMTTTASSPAASNFVVPPAGHVIQNIEHEVNIIWISGK
jgi:hypothetical protein